MKPLILSTLLCLGALVAVLPLSAQVTYEYDYSSINTSGFGASGGTITVQYNLVGDPAESPFGPSFFLTLVVSPIESVAGITPLTFSPLSSGIRFVIDGGVLSKDDLLSFPDGYSGSIRDDILDGVYSPNYKFTVDTNIPTAAGWELTSTDNLVVSPNSSGISGNGGAWSGSEFTVMMNEGGRWVSMGVTAEVGLVFVSRGIPPASYTGDPNRNRVNDHFEVNPLGVNLSLSDMVFSQVPEPGSAMLVLAGGALFLLKRPARSRSCRQEKLV